MFNSVPAQSLKTPKAGAKAAKNMFRSVFSNNQRPFENGNTCKSLEEQCIFLLFILKRTVQRDCATFSSIFSLCCAIIWL
jgi:hypothetical protein